MGQRSDCTSYPASDCTPIQWPGERTTARHEMEPDNNIQNWFGSLVDDMRDASGQMYRRNRYYDPQTGQFTQPDPIGLAGGVNAYAFAEGDPVTYADPYGLCPHASDPARRSSDLSTCTKEDWDRIRGGMDEPILLDPIVVVGVVGGGYSLVRSGWRGLRRFVGGLFGRGGGANAAKLTIPRNSSVLAVVDDAGNVIAHTFDETLSHAELVGRQLGGRLPEGAHAVTITKSRSGAIGVFNSPTYHQNRGPAGQEVVDAIKRVFQ